MKLLLSLAASLWLLLLANGQNSPIFLKVRTDATVLVRKHSTGADLVEITMRDPNYPVNTLQNQVLKMCDGFGTPPRGLQVGKFGLEGEDSKFQFVKATFATNGIILGDGRFDIQPMLQAFAGAPAPFTVQGITIDFADQSPTTSTVRYYGDGKSVEGEARYTSSGPLMGLEFRIELLTQNPAAIHFPSQYAPETKNETPAPRPSPKPSFLPILWVFLGAGVGVGALVYFALLRNGSKSRP